MSSSGNKLLQYDFIMQSVIRFLTDGDVLTRLLLTGKSMRSPLTSYRLKSVISASNMNRFYCEKSDRYLPVIVTRVGPAVGDDGPFVGMHQHIEEVTFARRPGSPVLEISYPTSLKIMRFGRYYTIDFNLIKLPPSLEVLRFGKLTHKPLAIGALPSTIEVLDMRSYLHDLIPGVIPSSVTRLKIEQMTTSPLFPGILPSSLKQLTLGSSDEFSACSLLVGSIPPTVEDLTLYCRISEFDPAMLPRSLVRFASPVNPLALPFGALPDSLTELDVSHSKLSPLVIPPKVIKLTINCIDEFFKIPDSVNTLSITSLQIHDPIPVGHIPSSVQQLEVRCPLHIGSIPNSVKRLSYQYVPFHDYKLRIGVFPASLETLLLLGSFNQDIEPGLIPHGVKELIIGPNFHRSIKVGSIPSTVEKLVLVCTAHEALSPGVIPNSVKYLQIGDSLSKPKTRVYIEQMGFKTDKVDQWMRYGMGIPSKPILVLGSIPQSVTHFTWWGPDPLNLAPGIIPNSVTSLCLESNQWDQDFDLERNVVPSSVKSLRVHVSGPGGGEIQSGVIPSSVTDLYVLVGCKVPRLNARVTYETATNEENADSDSSDDEDEDDDMDDDDDWPADDYDGFGYNDDNDPYNEYYNEYYADLAADNGWI